MVRLGKNGSDVTSAAIRLARHITGKDEVYVGGYHGWHDWSIAQDPIRNNGVPEAVRNLTFAKGESSMQNWAAAIMEPEFLTREQMQKWRKLADDCGFLLIFDEIITGFRFGMGGLQKVHGVTPDLSTFGKAMGNGMPISALVGLEKYMKRVTEISYSGTFFGEALSIAAAIATIRKLDREEVPTYLEDIGVKLEIGLNRSIASHEIKGIDIYGHSSLLRIKYGSKHLQSLVIQEMAKRGVLIIGSFNTCFAHKKPQIDHILAAWDGALKAIKNDIALDGKLVEGRAVR
jgi:glutamate-1-semialdehyde aminotransferase